MPSVADPLVDVHWHAQSFYSQRWQAVRRNPAERRAYLALAVAAGVLTAPAVVSLANSRGRGI